LALCSLVAVMVLVVAAVAAASAHLRCLDAAREAARLIARGDTDRAGTVAALIAPRDAVVRTSVSGDQVEVQVSAAVVPGLPGLSLRATAIGVLEPAALLATSDAVVAPGGEIASGAEGSGGTAPGSGRPGAGTNPDDASAPAGRIEPGTTP
jgi:hypothetical protein